MLSVGSVWYLKGIFLTMVSLGMVLAAGSGVRAEKKPVKVKLATTMGDIVLELYPDKAPVTVDNFVQYVKSGHYDGTIFHRVIDGFMIQGGGLDAKMNEKRTRAPIKNEADNGLKNEPYTIAMARTSDPNSATSQFFINVANNSRLNFTSKTPSGWGYAVFGKVIEGKDVVDKIKALPTTTKGIYQNVPQTPVTITKATVISQ
jgi:peptidyl-prolyl cis-trans isomerase B (cyclophilin B)